MQAQIGYVSLETHEVVQFLEEAATRERKFTTTTVARKLDEKSWAVSSERETNRDAIKNTKNIAKFSRSRGRYTVD